MTTPTTQPLNKMYARPRVAEAFVDLWVYALASRYPAWRLRYRQCLVRLRKRRNCSPLENTSPVPIAASMTLEVIGLAPGNVFRRAHLGSSFTNVVMSVDKPSMRALSRRQTQA
jgi:hypothetical protein